MDIAYYILLIMLGVGTVCIYLCAVFPEAIGWMVEQWMRIKRRGRK